ncbi:hypothetical protein CEXT_207191 [Caerostris extrusa]|uniref:Uncharacterized protein n=1 Tax=Caerostris extrusa TaxID=172846 RepID=A0AAV4SDC7_CAEEX|nr:hypothetical protein CEXT_207191 [Caerostris extrusa]
MKASHSDDLTFFCMPSSEKSQWLVGDGHKRQLKKLGLGKWKIRQLELRMAFIPYYGQLVKIIVKSIYHKGCGKLGKVYLKNNLKS